MTVKLVEQTPSADGFPLLIKHLLKKPLSYAPGQEIIYRDRQRYDYRTLEMRIHRLANGLKGLGIGTGDTVAVMDWDSHRYLECFFGIPMMGAILHTINVRLSPEQLIYTINHAEDDVILVHTDFLPLLESVKDQFTTVKHIILINEGDEAPQTSLSLDGDYETMLASAPDRYEFPDFDENARATTFYTTGTTGMPKGVYFSHRQLVLHTLAMGVEVGGFRNTFSLDSEDIYMPLTPMFHVHAWGLPYLCTLLGTRQVYPGRYEPETILKLIAQEGVTFSHCVPTILHMLLSSPAAREVDLSGWKVIIGGSALSRGLCQSAMDRGINLTTGYGMSETCPILTIASLKPHMNSWEPDRQVEMRCRTGLPIPLVNLEVVDMEGNPVPHDGASTGEVVAKTPWLTQGYLKEPERSEELWDNGWLHTGDIGWIDTEGYLQITDRLKDVIKTGGEWISSLQLEDIISQHPAVSEVAVVGVPDEKWGERPYAMVVLKEDFKGTVDEEELKTFCMGYVEKGIIPKYGVPNTVAIVETIAKTSVGKMNKKQLRKELGA